MTARPPNLQLAQDPEGDEDEGLDREQLRERIGFVLRAPRRRPKLAASLFLVVAGLGIAVAVTMPRTYSAQTKTLAQRNLVVPALTNPNRIPQDSESLTKNVADMILRRDNLVALAKELDLANRFYASRSPLLRLKDSITGGPKNDEEKLLGMVKTLEKQLAIYSDDSTMTIAVEWSEPQMAYDIVTHVQHNFLEARYDDQVAMISDAITVLQDHAKKERERLDVALDEYQKLLTEQGPKAGSLGRITAPPLRAGGGWGGPVARPATAADPELVAALEDKRRQVRALQEERQRELDALKQQLTQAQLTLTLEHPTVQALEQQIEARSQPSPDLLQLKNDERALAAKLAPPATSTSTPPSTSAAVPRVSVQATIPGLPPIPNIPALPDWDDDGRAQLARSKLDAAIKGYEDVSGRIEAANIELDIAHTAFKYRYTVITPAEIPGKPKKPMAAIVAVGSVVGAALLAILSAVAADALGGRILEAWQIRQRLKVDVLGEIDSP